VSNLGSAMAFRFHLRIIRGKGGEDVAPIRKTNL
jgi:hypothetical protein